MTTALTITRSASWVRKESLERGENVQEQIHVIVDLTKLSRESREALMGKEARFPGYFYGFDLGGWNYINIEVDSDKPSISEIDEAIVRAHARLVEHHRAEELRMAEDARRETELRNARELLHEEIQAAEALRLSAEERAASAQANLRVVAEFLAAVPEDALRSTLRTMISGMAMYELQSRIENASPVQIFFEDE